MSRMSIERWYPGPVTTEPDFENILAVLRREAPGRPTLFEFFMNERFYRTVAPGVAEELAGEPWAEQRLMIHAFANAGFDYVTLLGSDFAFAHGEIHKMASQSQNEGAVITDRASFAAYRWPEPEDFSTGRLDELARFLPGGMKIVSQGPCGLLENVTFLVGFENLCYLVMDDPDLAGEIFDAVGSRLVRYYEMILAHEAVGAVIGNDDWGFKTQPMLSPPDMRKYVVPWHERIVATAHAAGRPAILHSCGNLTSLMDDVIDEIGYDAKHSYEDTIQPIEDAYEQYHDRIALVGGLDLDFVIRSSPQAVHDRARAMLARAADRGGYALGTGNSVPDYVPDENYLALIAAARA